MYPGGKNQAGTYQTIINLIPPHRTYIETHLGGGAIARAKKPAARNILIDIDPAVIATFGELTGCIAVGGDGISPSSIVQTDDAVRIVISGVCRPGDRITAIDDTAINGDTCRRPSPGVAIPDPIALDGDAAAASKTAIGAPIAKAGDMVTTPDAAMAASLSRNGDAAARYELICTDSLAFLQLFSFQGDEFIYCDPPYLMSTRSSQRQIYRYELSEADHVALLACLLSLPCKVMLSGYWSELYADTLTGWHTVSFQAITRGGRMATEWLWMNYPPPVRLHEYTYLGKNFRERERIKRKKSRWLERLRQMDLLERQAILAALSEVGFD